MAEPRIRPDIIVASILALIFAAIAGIMSLPDALNPLARAEDSYVFLRPYLHVMTIASLANAVLIMALVPVCRTTSGWIKSSMLWCAVIISTFIVAELAAFALTKKLFHVAHVGSRYTNSLVFSPSLGYLPKPGFRYPIEGGEITHTSDGYRGPKPPPGDDDTWKRVVLIGGSSTYDIGLPDDQTWPTDLGRLFAEQVRVFNLGVPGHSTAEHVALASLVAWKYHPDLIIYYIGWNDIRSSHVDESTDYARFHKKRMFHNFGVTEPTSLFALSYIIKKIITVFDPTSLYNLSFVEIPTEPMETIDSGLLDIYIHNVGMLAAITREIGAIPVFVPQIMNVHRLTSDEPYGWIPRLPQRAIPDMIEVFNEAMMGAAHEAGAVVIPEVLAVDWQDSDFVDRGHFSQRGAQRFACALAEGLSDRGVIIPSAEETVARATDCSRLSEKLVQSSPGPAPETMIHQF